MASTSKSAFGIDTAGRQEPSHHEKEKPKGNDEPMDTDSCEEDEEVQFKHVPPKPLPIRYPEPRMMGKDYDSMVSTSKKAFWSKRYGAYMVGDSNGFNIRFKRYRKKNGNHQLYIQMNTLNDGVRRSTWQCWPMDGALQFAEAIQRNYEEVQAYAPN